jgi:hypothetical protein
VSYYQSGLFYEGGRMKPYLRGFRFPLVAFPRPGGIYVWGRTPAGAPGRVIVEHSISGGTWKRLGDVTTNRFGMFERTFHALPTGRIRARRGSEDATLPFSLRAVRDRFFNPFGVPRFEPKKKKPPG